MTIKRISKLVSLSLAIIIIAFAVAVSWSLKHLNEAFGTVEFFGQQKDKIFTQVSQPILNYLLTGEATILTSVEHTLMDIKGDVVNFFISRPLKFSISSDLKSDLKSDLILKLKVCTSSEVSFLSTLATLSPWVLYIQRYHLPPIAATVSSSVPFMHGMPDAF